MRANIVPVLLLPTGTLHPCRNHQNRVPRQTASRFCLPLRFRLCKRKGRHPHRGTLPVFIPGQTDPGFHPHQRHHPGALSGGSSQTSKKAPNRLAELPNMVWTDCPWCRSVLSHLFCVEVEKEIALLA